ncbi:hypothetical protein GCM10027596_40150 [Nocardioides korecus]
MSAPAITAPGTHHLAAPVDVEELKRAWHAVRAGDFRGPSCRAHDDRRDDTRGADTWVPEPQEELLVVLGCAGSSGATTVALAMALSAVAPVRVVECGSVTASGLVAASTAELGLHPGGGWVQGRRGHVQLERTSELLAGPHVVPHPVPFVQLPTSRHAEADRDEAMTSCLTILDAGWEAGQLLITDSWIAGTVRTTDHLVLTTRATAPGVRRLEGVLDLLSGRRDLKQIKVAVIGPRRKKWHRSVEHAGGPGVRRILDTGNYVEIPELPDLAAFGLDSRPLPARVVDAACRLLPTPQYRSDRAPTDNEGTEP